MILLERGAATDTATSQWPELFQKHSSISRQGHASEREETSQTNTEIGFSFLVWSTKGKGGILKTEPTIYDKKRTGNRQRERERGSMMYITLAAQRGSVVASRKQLFLVVSGFFSFFLSFLDEGG